MTEATILLCKSTKGWWANILYGFNFHEYTQHFTN